MTTTNFNATTPSTGTSFRSDPDAAGALVQGVSLLLAPAAPGGTAVPLTGAQVASSSLPVALPTDQIGTAATGVSQPTGGAGLYGWLSGIFSKIPAQGVAASAASLPIVLASNDAQIGTDGTGITQPTGGAGIRGWLSGIFSKLSGTLTVRIVGNGITDHSSTITTGGTAQQLMPANASRSGYIFQNQSSGTLTVNDWTGTAGSANASSRQIASGAYFETPPGYCPTGIISVYGATSAAAFSCQEF